MAAGTSMLDFWVILETSVSSGKTFIDNCFWNLSPLL